jgi:uroporphyrinogen decarboxylase
MLHDQETMTSRERVLRAFHRLPADRVPIDYLSNPGIDARLKQHYGLALDDDEGLRQVLWVDLRDIGAPYRGPRLHAEQPGIHVDPLWGIHTRWIEHPSGGYWDYCDFPLRDADAEQVARWPLPNPDDFDYAGVADACRRYDHYALCVRCFGDLINGNGFLRGMEQTLVDLQTDEPAGLLLADRRFAAQAAIAERLLAAARGRIDIFWLGEDLGTQKAPMISPRVFKKHVRPRYQKLVDLAKAYGAQTMIHTCGSSSWAYEDFIAMGIDAVDTLQPEAVNMSPEYLVQHFGGRLSFHGCISTAGPLAYGTPAQVRQAVQDTLDIMMPTRSYLLSPTHDIQDNTPTENAVAMYDAAKELGWYRVLREQASR